MIEINWRQWWKPVAARDFRVTPLLMLRIFLVVSSKTRKNLGGVLESISWSVMIFIGIFGGQNELKNGGNTSSGAGTIDVRVTISINKTYLRLRGRICLTNTSANICPNFYLSKRILLKNIWKNISGLGTLKTKMKRQ